MHGRRWWALVTSMVLLAQAAGPSGAPATPAPPSAEMLLDLDLLRETNLTRDRDLLRRLQLLERMRMLENWRMLDSAAPIVPTQKEAR